MEILFKDYSNLVTYKDYEYDIAEVAKWYDKCRKMCSDDYGNLNANMVIENWLYGLFKEGFSAERYGEDESIPIYHNRELLIILDYINGEFEYTSQNKDVLFRCLKVGFNDLPYVPEWCKTVKIRLYTYPERFCPHIQNLFL